MQALRNIPQGFVLNLSAGDPTHDDTVRAAARAVNQAVHDSNTQPISREAVKSENDSMTTSLVRLRNAESTNTHHSNSPSNIATSYEIANHTFLTSSQVQTITPLLQPVQTRPFPQQLAFNNVQPGAISADCIQMVNGVPCVAKPLPFATPIPISSGLQISSLLPPINTTAEQNSNYLPTGAENFLYPDS